MLRSRACGVQKLLDCNETRYSKGTCSDVCGLDNMAVGCEASFRDSLTKSLAVARAPHLGFTARRSL